MVKTGEIHEIRGDTPQEIRVKIDDLNLMTGWLKAIKQGTNASYPKYSMSDKVIVLLTDKALGTGYVLGGI